VQPDATGSSTTTANTPIELSIEDLKLVSGGLGVDGTHNINTSTLNLLGLDLTHNN
jgi:hypothetical protein